MTTIANALDETREFVTRMTVDTYSDRSAQRCIPTFVTVAGGALHTLHEKGGLHVDDHFGMDELTELIGHLNMLWMAAFFNNKMNVVELAGNMRGVGYSYHLTDEQISGWQETLRNCAGDESPIATLVAYFDRIMELKAQIFGPDCLARSQNWIVLLGDINTNYHAMMDNPNWIADLDAALDRAGSPAHTSRNSLTTVESTPVRSRDEERTSAIDAINDLFEFRNMPNGAEEISAALATVGLTLVDVKSNPDLVFEAGIARNVRRACEALNISVTPHQSLTLAKHSIVGADHYRNGVPLSPQERSIALKLREVHLRTYCEKHGFSFTDEQAHDCVRAVRFGERGLHVGHKIGEASGCFQVVLFAVASGLYVLLFVFQLIN